MRRLTKQLTRLALLAIAATLPLLASAHDFEVSGIYYNINGNNATVTYRGSSYDAYSNEYTGAVNIPSTVTYNGTTYSVTSIGDYAFWDCSGLTSVTIPNSVTTIGDGAFYYCSGLTSVTIPNSVTTIGDSAFWGCSGLTSVTIPNSVTEIGNDAFSGCSGLTSVTIPNSVTSIPNYCFVNCSGLTSLTIPNSVTEIGEQAFGWCFSLTSLTIPNSVTSIGSRAFKNCSGLKVINSEIEYPYEVSLGYSVFDEVDKNNCKLFVPDEMSSELYEQEEQWRDFSNIIGGAFLVNGLYIKYNNIGVSVVGYSNSGNIIIPNDITINGNNYSVTSIGSNAFWGCSGLTGELTIPNSVTWIGKRAFKDCIGLTSVTIPSSVSAIYGGAFVDCSNLTTVYWNAKNCSILEDDEYSTTYWEDVHYYYDSPFSYEVGRYYYDGIEWCLRFDRAYSPIKVFIIGDEVEQIPSKLCIGCSRLTSVTIPNSVTSIGNVAFSRCSGLTSIIVENGNTTYDSRNNCNAIIETETNTLIAGCKNTLIPNSVTLIGNDAFFGCSDLTSVTIPNSVTSIGDGAFSGCDGLISIYSKIKNPQNNNYGTNIFYDVPTSQCSLYVPHCKYDIYSATTPWNAFSNIIETDPTGDVNDDDTVDVTDFEATANYILEMDPQPFYMEECDFYENGIITVSDLVGVALHYGDVTPPWLNNDWFAPAIGTNETPILVMDAQVMGKNGNYKVTINLDNSIDLTALQMDLGLPTGMTLASASLSDRASESHQLAFNQLSNGDYRLLASSPLLESFAGYDGAMLTLSITGVPKGIGTLSNIELATPLGESYEVYDIDLDFILTGVETVTADTRIYSDGSNIIIDSPVAGTAQIVLPNGISKTVTVTAGKNIIPAPASGMVIVKMDNSVKKLQIK